jgi:LmbE family N-acetylglucosaminyl deacetylase
MNVLVIAPHPDDEAIGCGGAICRHAARGDRVRAVFLTSGEQGLKHLAREQAWRVREAEARTAAAILGIAGLEFLRLADWAARKHLRRAAPRLRALLERDRPELIYLPHPGEWHPDHQAAWPCLRAALRGWRGPAPAVRGYEVWTPLARYDEVEDISRVMPRKLRAVRAHRSQVRGWDYARAVAGLNQYRGVMAARCRYAEVFQTLHLGTAAAKARHG